MRTKSQGNEVILSTYWHPNLIRTTPLLIEFCLSKFKTKINKVKLQHLLQDTFTILHETNNQSIVPNLFNIYQLFATIVVTIITIIVALFLSLLYTMFLRLVFYITQLHKIQVRFLSQPFQIPKAKWTPVLINKIWYYRMHQKSSQVVSE